MPPSPPLRQILAEASQAHRRGQLDQAERLYQQVLGADPAQPEALHYLGLLAHQTRRPELAERLLRQSLAQATDDPRFHFNYAAVLAEQGRHREAVPYYQRSLELASGDPDTWHGLASALVELGHAEDAIACWQRGLAIAPEHAASLRGLADCLHALNRHAERLDICRRLHAVSAGAPEAGVQLAEALSDMGRDDDALELLHTLLQRHPGTADGHCLEGVILSARGDFSGAAKAFESAIAAAQGFHEAMNRLAAIRKLAPTEPLVQRLVRRAHDRSWSDLAEAVNASFALGKIFEDAGEYDVAFSHFQEGNRLYRENIRYSTESQSRYFERLRECFGAGFQARRVGSRAACRPIFIVGMPRSGTTLVEQILAAHGDVYAGGELTLLTGLIRAKIGGDFVHDMPGSVAALSDADIAGIGAGYLSHVQSLAPQARRITDKMPSNFMQLGLIRALFPEAIIVHCSRDPMDTCVSCFTTLFKNGQLFSYDLKELGEFHRLYAGMMDFWDGVMPGTIYRMGYEKLVADLEGEARRLVEHCGLAWDPKCLAFDSAPTTVRTASVYQVRQPLYKTSVQRWRRYERHLGPLAEALGLMP